MYENQSKLPVPFIVAIGAVFDFYAGTKKRSSDFWIKTGKEPRRLWERNLKSTPIFLWWIIKEKIKQVRGNISDTEAEG
ncbi:MAG: WecB/TagA/CpsF family glycosyltransferase [Proteobacteria bacterium]|nr:WecB/TagA/CpsF family glycosyltransferase [Desulfobacteraceae bacterium]MBU3980335.1 WecB/TagA/CpsF family glycosyltransferase [Pseudomonadota bacterium]MBU4013083.1 WecB/TagA/CpsF family glycosyltransferase [Pseudomonadota bacterium]